MCICDKQFTLFRDQMELSGRTKCSMILTQHTALDSWRRSNDQGLGSSSLFSIQSSESDRCKQYINTSLIFVK